MAVHMERTPFHPGEQAIHKLLRIPPRDNPTWAGLPPALAYRVAASPLVAFGALDKQGRPWTTVWGGEEGFAGPLGSGVIGARSLVDGRHDPVLEALLLLDDGRMDDDGKGKKEEGNEGYQITREELESGRGRLMAGLSIDLATRDRVKLAGRLVAGRVDRAGEDEAGHDDGVADVQVAMLVEESLGNCPKYLNRKAIHPQVPAPQLVSDTLPLPPQALDLLARADMFFLSSTDGRSMDTNHRGGPPGFVRVLSNTDTTDDGGVCLVYPEYSGNRLYHTLGNLHTRPLTGLCIPDFVTGDVLYLTGETAILAGADAARLLPRTKLAVRIRVTAARFVRRGLSFRGDVVDYSPYNPPVRRLAAEMATAGDAATGDDGQTGSEDKAVATAVLVGREIITPTVACFTFRLLVPRRRQRWWRPGQHITLDFSGELDVGWSHMRDDDPGSLNDDFVRTFTVSSVPGGGGDKSDEEELRDGAEMQITVRRHGPATGLLWRWNMKVPLEVPVLGFGGQEGFLIGGDGAHQNGGRNKKKVFVAAGVGITPLLAQAPGLLAKGEEDVTLLWSLRGEDVAFAVDVFERIEGLAGRTKVFLTGDSVDAAIVNKMEALGGQVIRGRIDPEEVLREGGGGGTKTTRYYLCTGSEMMKVLLGWLEGEDVVYESFEY
ncbi:hypothetical protein M406DRAFT_74656 [Cryphonectria parasitica EP155]|uniref:FAD-binding FR-type domain-containing protein n=1 Tax=Cryphonectria parasitica (strain ATCC 38755 / EP155) TaxID=660469 RepID=A0A9P4XW82_CRYP1|nr:uncharacterized protein M406DRAFT_74656 [Cryphonectria parasitica EP155]KAF3761715.1 hypothetical protein M406DRAFT_74656 [Cryphonectria parasitica EP155]